MDSKITMEETRAINRIINFYVIKSVWWVTIRKKSETIDSQNIITKHAYQEILKGKPAKYEMEKIWKIWHSSDKIRKKEIEGMLDGSISLMDDDSEYKYVYDGIKECLNPSKDKDRSIQSYETEIRAFVRRQKREFDKAPVRCNPFDLRRLFEYFVYGDTLASDYEFKVIEKALDDVPFKSFIKNIDKPEVLEKHEKAIKAYLLRLQAVIILKEQIKGLKE